jgi:multidrug efflux pump
MAYEWTELTFIELDAKNQEKDLPFGYKFKGDTTGVVFAVSVITVFLVLAALYESWTFPLAVILVVPVCVSCSLAGIWITDPGSAAATAVKWNALGIPDWLKPGSWAGQFGAWLDSGPIALVNGWVKKAGVSKQDVNIFTQVGFVVLIGLACKNAILIVEFAKVARDRGVDVHTAVMDACKLRFRPILMTSVAFMLGVLPLAIARGAGGEMRQALGVAVLGGMAGVTAFGVILTPVFFALVDRASMSVVFRNKYLRAVSEAFLFMLSFKFVRPMGGIVKTAASKSMRRVVGRREPRG